jgi:non-specific serine/threonine protein kinase
VAQGYSNAAVATRLGISRHTAERHVERVLRKLGIRSRAAVAARLLGSTAGEMRAAAGNGNGSGRE